MVRGQILTILGEDANNGSILVDVFNGVFNLKKSSIGVETGGLLVVLAGL